MINNAYDGSGKRLFCIRKALGMTQIEFAKIVNSSNGHVSDMEKDRKNITESTIELLKLKCNVNEDWLRTGYGEMFNPESTDTLDQLIAEYELSDIASAMIKCFINLKPEVQNEMFSFFNNVVSLVNGNSKPDKGTKTG